MSNANPPFQDLSLDPAEMIARKRGIRSRIVKRFRISGNWKWIAKSSPGEFCGPQRLASATPTNYASGLSMD